jgi:hypothetical protein
MICQAWIAGVGTFSVYVHVVLRVCGRDQWRCTFAQCHTQSMLLLQMIQRHDVLHLVLRTCACSCQRVQCMDGPGVELLHQLRSATGADVSVIQPACMYVLCPCMHLDNSLPSSLRFMGECI